MRTTTRVSYAVAAVAAVAVVLALAGCGGDDSSDQSPADASAAGGNQDVATGKTKFGTVLVDHDGRTLYAFAADTKDTSNCTASCATYWPPVDPGKGAVSHADAVAAEVGTTTRPDGSTQLTVDGWPMYTYAADSEPGQASGQGKNLSGGLWWVVAPDGKWIEQTEPPGGPMGGY